jgi:putative flippase GtrA
MNIKNFVHGIFYKPTDNTILQLFRYCFVGGAAFIVDAAVLWGFEHFTHYLIASAIAFMAGLISNFILSKLFVFTESKTKKSIEFLAYTIIGVIGLIFTELLMYVFTDILGLYFMLSKIITAVIVLIWNFAARKFILYRGISN